MKTVARIWHAAWPGTLFILALLVIWEVLARRAASPSFPGALAMLHELVQSGPEMAREMGTTLWRSAAGLLLALATMLPLGIFIGRVRAVGDYIEPVFDMLRPLPALAVIPLVMIFAGVGSTAKILVIYYSVSFPIVLSTIDAVRGAHPMLSNVARSLRLSRGEIMLQIDLPQALPKIMVGVRIAVALAILVSVSAEMLLSTDGMGYFIVRAQQQFRIGLGMAALLVIAVTALVVNGLVAWTERRLLRWHHDRQAATASS